jgi:hypothetical protein
MLLSYCNLIPSRGWTERPFGREAGEGEPQPVHGAQPRDHVRWVRIAAPKGYQPHETSFFTVPASRAESVAARGRPRRISAPDRRGLGNAGPSHTTTLSPDRLTIGSIAPNPFRANATVTFSIARPGRVNVDVLDLAGRKVRSLMHEAELSGGEHRSVWDRRDERGEALPAGVYFVRVRAGDQVGSGRLLLLD